MERSEMNIVDKIDAVIEGVKNSENEFKVLSQNFANKLGKQLMQISFSGGRTSAYMTKMLLDNKSDEYDFIVTFANTGREHPKTLEFINNCDKHFGFNTVWLETVVHEGRVGCTHKIVNFETAARNGEPFESVIKKYGIPNTAFPGCTRDLKLAPMRSYLKSLGIDHKTIPTAIGIREDEKRRISKQAELNNIVYPLIDWFPTDKSEVIDWWKQQVFDLEIEEFEGNCLGCYKKSFKKHFMQIEKDIDVYKWTKEMEDKYCFVNIKEGKRVFFRNNTSTEQLIKMYRETVNQSALSTRAININEDGGCSESCEVYETSLNNA